MVFKEVLCDGWFPRYLVNENGDIIRKDTGEFVKQYRQKSGYMAVYLKSTRNETCIRMVHRIVAMAFLPPPNGERCYVDHINTIRHDNRAENLRWVTPKENANNEQTKKNRRNAILLKKTRNNEQDKQESKTRLRESR